MNVRQKLSLAAMCIALPALASAQAPAAAAPAAPAPAPAIEIKPYGILSLTLQKNDGRFGSAAQDYAKYVTSEDQGSFVAGARQSRFGVNVKVPGDNLLGATLGGKLEFDFMGPTGSSWDSAVPRLRYATVDASLDLGPGKLLITAGQTDGVVNKLHPEGVAYLASPVFVGAGNILRRTPQLRVGYDFKVAEMVGLLVEGAVGNPSDGVDVNYSAGNRSESPDIEARLAATVKPMADVAVNLGVGYHTNTKTYDGATAGSTEDVTATMIGVDAVVDATKFLQIRGEFYKAAGAQDTYGGISSKVVVGAAGSRDAVDESGFWAQAIVKPIPEAWLALGYGKATADYGADANIAAGDRESNSQLYVGVIGHLSKAWRVGVEYLAVTSNTYTAAGATGTTELKGSQISLATQLRF